MGKPDAPTPPDPVETASAANSTNLSTSVANTMMGNVNQIGADGSSLTYDQTGTYKYTDPYTGITSDVPRFTATQNLSDAAQGIFDTNQGTQANLANLGQSQSSFLNDYMSKPFDGSTDAIESHLFDLGSRTLDPKFAQQREALETQLSNQGIKLGSEAYDRAMSQMGETQNATYNDLLLSGRGQAFGELQAQRNQPLNEIMALMSGSQVSQPNYNVNRPTGIPTTDVAGLINANYGQQQQNYQNEMSAWSDGIGGLFGLGSAAITAGLF